MKMNLLLAAFLLFVVTGTGYGLGFQKRVQVQHEFDLKAGSQAIVKEAGLKITFVELVEDSRCPEGVTCIWAGNGRIKVSVRKGGHNSVSFELNTMTEPKSFAYRGYEILLVRLAPYPKNNVEIRKRDYVATLKVTKKKD
jgi:hypothetical protein